MFSFFDLEKRFGSAAAYSVLAEIEKTVKAPSWQMADIDPEQRLMNACRAQDMTMIRCAA